LDEKGFIRAGADVRSTQRSPLPLETGVEGVFAVGDVRCGSVKRVGAAIGEGAAVVAQLHTFLARRDPTATSATLAEARRPAAPLGYPMHGGRATSFRRPPSPR